jgi:hypothetical protein
MLQVPLVQTLYLKLPVQALQVQCLVPPSQVQMVLP